MQAIHLKDRIRHSKVPKSTSLIATSSNLSPENHIKHGPSTWCIPPPGAGSPCPSSPASYSITVLTSPATPCHPPSDSLAVASVAQAEHSVTTYCATFAVGEHESSEQLVGLMKSRDGRAVSDRWEENGGLVSACWGWEGERYGMIFHFISLFTLGLSYSALTLSIQPLHLEYLQLPHLLFAALYFYAIYISIAESSIAYT